MVIVQTYQDAGLVVRTNVLCNLFFFIFIIFEFSFFTFVKIFFKSRVWLYRCSNFMYSSLFLIKPHQIIPYCTSLICTVWIIIFVGIATTNSKIRVDRHFCTFVNLKWSILNLHVRKLLKYIGKLLLISALFSFLVSHALTFRNANEDLDSTSSDRQKCVSEDEMSRVGGNAFSRKNPARRSTFAIKSFLHYGNAGL